jgi:hypothetical protein
MPGDISTMKAQDFDAWVAWLRAPTKPQCFGLLARWSRPNYPIWEDAVVEEVCAIGGGCLALGEDPRPNSLFYTGLPYGLYTMVTTMNDNEHLPFATIADHLQRVRERYVRHA